jgi:hypothetical protein
MRRLGIFSAMVLAMPLGAQGNAASAPPVEAQVAAAVLALPEEFRASATVLSVARYPDVVLRQGTGPMICLADTPGDARFHVACYHKDLEPFMHRGREMRAQGVAADSVNPRRNAEVESGRIPMPKQGALWQLFAPADSMDWATNTARGARSLYVVYMPGATTESTGIPASAPAGVPWLMFPGTPRAHIMFVPTM